MVTTPYVLAMNQLRVAYRLLLRRLRIRNGCNVYAYLRRGSMRRTTCKSYDIKHGPGSHARGTNANSLYFYIDYLPMSPFKIMCHFYQRI